MRIIVGGSRSLDDYTLVEQVLDKLTAKLDKTRLVILSGGATGADRLGEQWCFRRLLRYEVWKAEWIKHGKKAGVLRTVAMLQDGRADGAVFFWDGKSPGTKHSIDLCKRLGIKVKVVRF